MSHMGLVLLPCYSSREKRHLLTLEQEQDHISPEEKINLTFYPLNLLTQFSFSSIFNTFTIRIFVTHVRFTWNVVEDLHFSYV